MQLAASAVGVSGVHFATLNLTYLSVCTPSTLRRFDHKVHLMVKTGPLIPWERRLTILEIPENQEATFGTRFVK